MTDSAKQPSSIPRGVVNVVAILVVAFVIQRINSNDTTEMTSVASSQESATTQTARLPDTVKLRVTGAESTEGTINAALFFSDQGFPNNESASHAQSTDATNQEQGVITMEIAAEHFATGKPFAIAVYHDVNSDGIIDKSLVGAPTETYGFTNNARSTFGPPTFDAAALPALDPTKGPRTIEVKLR